MSESLAEDKGSLVSAAVTSELLTLSIHEALTFEGVELAISPDIFKGVSSLSCTVGDFVELRVWEPLDRAILTKTSPKFQRQVSIDSRGESKTDLQSTPVYKITTNEYPSKDVPLQYPTSSPNSMVYLHDSNSTPNDDTKGDASNNEDMITLVSKSHHLRVSFVMIVTERSLTTLKSSGRTQISLLRQVADLYHLSSYDLVTVTKFPPNEEAGILQSVQADFLTVTIKDQFISRGEMHQFQQSFTLHGIYSGQRLCTDGMRGTVAQIRHENGIVKTAIVTDNTKFTFRSRSARIIWLVQISSEMWDYHSQYESARKGDYECGTYFDKFVSFMYVLFEKWKALEATHSLTVIFFSRTFLFSSKNKGAYSSRIHEMNLVEDQAFVQKDVDGRMYEDHYKVVVENETRVDWDALIYTIKKAFISFPLELNWMLTKNLSKIPSTASQGNLLESINTTLNMLHNHYMDRDLKRTGNSILIITAGSGVFEVDKNLAAITKQRMMDNGIGSDLLSLGLAPLHIAPFFLYKEALHSTEEISGDWKALFEIPHWMHLSFVSYDSIVTKNVEKKNTEPSNNQVTIMPNGFIFRSPASSQHNHGTVNLETSESRKTGKYRHFLSDRDFEDILAACRPRNHGEYMSALPSTLLATLKIFSQDSSQHDPGRFDEINEAKTDLNQIRDISVIPPSANMNDAMTSSKGFKFYRNHDVDTLSSSFNSAFSFLRDCKPTSHFISSPMLEAVQIQQLSSFDIPLLHLGSTSRPIARSKSDESLLSTRGEDTTTSIQMKFTEDLHANQYNPTLIANQLQELMHQYDMSVYDKNIRGNIASSHEDGKAMSVKRKERKLNSAGGIGAALNQFDQHTRSEPIKDDNSRNFKGLTFQSPKVSSNYPSLIKNKAATPNFNSIDRFQLDTGTDSANLSRSPKTEDGTLEVSPRKELALPRSLLQTPNHLSRQNHRAPLDQKDQNSNTILRGGSSHRKLWTLNPFRQSDEEQVLAERTHNSRRWSHVFPQGEIEFKRHPGPNWNSLTQPAILPITIDFHPPQQELNDPSKYQFKHYEVMLDAMDLSNYGSHAELLMEMVRQRLVQDFQLVPSNILNRNKQERKDSIAPSGPVTADLIIQHTLSMGHRIQVLTYDPRSENNAISVIQYLALLNLQGNTFHYRYKLWCNITRRYIGNSQTFVRFPAEYPWNQFDNLICGDLKKELSGGTRFRRLNYRIIPEQFKDASSELEYLKKFKRFMEYVEKQVQQELGIQINAHLNSEMTIEGEGRRGRACKSFTIPLRKSRHENYEWIEMVLDSVFDTSRTYHIKFHWLVASAIRVDALIQLLQRRCIQYGLRLIAFPQTSISSNMTIHPFIRPMTVIVPDREKARSKEKGLISMFNFIDDGIIMVHPKDALDAFGVVLSKSNVRRYSEEKTQQYVHVSGLLFVRILHDQSGWSLFAFMGNRRLIGTNEELRTTKRQLFEQVSNYLKAD